MNVAFLFQGPLPQSLARVMCESVRKAMPGVRIHQLTDLGTPSLTFVDAVQRVDLTDLIDFRFQHLARFPEDMICLDYDCIVQRDIGAVFDQPFDLAFTRRPKADRTASQGAAAAMPHNLGVIFQRTSGKAFWSEMSEEWTKGEYNWLAGQMLVSQKIAKGDFNILELPGEYYNYTPSKPDEDLRARAVVHYKGNRKHWMVPGEETRQAGEHINEITECAIDELNRGA
jgi:hypothetical protein